MNTHCSPERLESRDTKARSHDRRNASSIAHSARFAERGTHTHPRKHRITSMRRSLCNGGGGADEGTTRDVTIALACTQATAQIVSVAVHGTSGAHGQHWHASVWANLRVGHCSRHCGRSSEPGCEAGTHPWDGHGSTLSSALRHGHGERHEQRCR
jgi:hypothetical protein